MNSAAATADCTIIENLERLARIEPVVESLEDSHSAIELQPRILERSAGIEPAPRHWQSRILPLDHDRQTWWTRGKSNPHFRFAGPECSRYHYAPKSWCPVRLGIPGPLVCRTSAHNPSELTGQIFSRREQSIRHFVVIEVSATFTTARILVGAKGPEPSPLRVRAGCAAARAPHRWS